MAAVLEAGQILIADRFFDPTDFVITVAGMAVAWRLARRELNG